MNKIKINRYANCINRYELRSKYLDEILNQFIDNRKTIIFHGDKVKVSNISDQSELFGTVFNIKDCMESELDINYLKYDIITSEGSLFQTNYQNLELITQSYGNKMMEKRLYNGK